MRRNFFKARIVYNEFHAVKLIVEAMDDTARRTVEIQAINARIRHLMRTNVSKFSGEHLRALERSIGDYRELAENYRLKNLFSDIYRQYDKGSASEVLDLWYRNVQAFDTQAMRTVFKGIYSCWKRILVWYDKSINNGFAEVVSNIQTTCIMARGFKNIDYFTTIVSLQRQTGDLL